MKMKFTKVNVVKVVDDYFCQTDFESCTDLIAEIHNLEDIMEKVTVPKYVAEYIERKKEIGAELQTMFRCYRYFYDNINSYPESDNKKAVQWYVDNPYKFIRAYEEGYTITSL